MNVLLQLSQSSEKPGEGLGSSVAPECLGFCSQGWRGWETLNTAPQAHSIAAEMASALPKSPILMCKLKGGWGPGCGQGRGHESLGLSQASLEQPFCL